MNNKNGFSLTELLVSLIISSILILTVGVLSSMANSSFNKINIQQQVYNDISYGLKLMQNRIRGAQGSVSVSTPGANWVGKKLIVGNQAFGIYNAGDSKKDLVYLANQSDESKREIILSVPDPGESCAGGLNCLEWEITCHPNTDCSSLKSITAAIKGAKSKIPFEMKTTIFGRNL